MLPRFDQDRFLYSLAGVILSCAWEGEAVRRGIAAMTAARGISARSLARRTLIQFATRPGYYDLAAFLRSKKYLWRAAGERRAGRLLPLAAGGVHLPTRLAGLGLPKIETEGQLAAWLGIRLPRLGWLADVSGRNRLHPPGPLRPYRYRWISKRTGRSRLLEIPKRRLKELQRIILDEILYLVPVHPAAHGFCPGRSILTHATPHCGRQAVLRLDLEDFFPSISSARVFWIFHSLGYPPRVSRLLTGLCTTRLPAAVWEARPHAVAGGDFDTRQRFITRHLPQGAPTSPALANLAAARLDRRLSGLARACKMTYTRYADDLTFSGDAALARRRPTLEPLVGAIAIEEGFALNFRKTRLMRAGVRQTVTGVIVNVVPNVARADFDRLKAILTNCARHGPASQNRGGELDFRAHLQGRVSHVAAIHAARGERLRRLFEAIDWSR